MKNNEIEDEKSIDALSFKNLESQKIVLPQNVFRSDSNWIFYELYKTLASRNWMVLWLPVIVWCKIFVSFIDPFHSPHIVGDNISSDYL
ncbi:CDN_1a_G0004930.mRNA.1.CDS.1 [Saccharomyces cerevisiae]|nr:CDN_1a_G0004930.mRNA.1.CDS.1 [Saccharomyces cerevisiae]CAI7161901.1 CDN_1a_G0004930.mRNA.1.CDS.1 [Saccharomyces cerevisiae]